MTQMKQSSFLSSVWEHKNDIMKCAAAGIAGGLIYSTLPLMAHFSKQARAERAVQFYLDSRAVANGSKSFKCDYPLTQAHANSTEESPEWRVALYSHGKGCELVPAGAR